MRSSDVNSFLRGLREWRIYALLAVSLLLWSVAYQYKASYEVNVGGLQDDAYVTGFHGKEGNPERDYRWNRGYSTVTFPGIGNQPVEVSLSMVGFRPEGESPQVRVEARGQYFLIQTRPEPHSETLFLPRGDLWESDLIIGIGSPTFRPPNDPRDLGVLVDRVTVRPADFGLRPVVVPPPGTLLGLFAGLIAAYVAALIAARRVRWALLGVAALAATFTILIVTARPEMGLLAPQLPVLGAWAVAVAALSRLILGAILSSPTGKGSDLAVSLGALAAVGGFVLRFGGLTYPQFLTSDILLHAHNVQRVALDGQWVFPGYLPDYTPVPYPPALYVILAPFALLFGADDASISLHLKFALSLLDAACCLALAWAGARLWGGLAGGVAALLYAFSPAPFELFSAGNYTNLFGQAALNLTLLAALVFLRNPTPNENRHVSRFTFHASLPLLALSAGFALTMLGHYGMMLSTLPILILFGLWVVYSSVRGKRPTRGWLVLASAGGALLASSLLYYRHFISEMWSQWSMVFRRFAGTEPGRRVIPEGSEAAREGFVERSARRVSQLIGFPTLLPALFGALLPSRLSAPHALLGAWLGAAAFFFAVDQALGDAIRWYYLAAAPVALLAGRFLAQLATAGRPGSLLAAFLLAAALWHLLQIWVGEMIFTRYH